MAKRISEEIRKEIMKLYNNGHGFPRAKIVEKTKVSPSFVHGLTRESKRINPETKKPYESSNKYQEYMAMQKTSPETGTKFKSRHEYQEYLAGSRDKEPENIALSNLIKKQLEELGKDRTWLAIKIRETPYVVSQYEKGRSIPIDDTLQLLFSSLEVPYKTLDDLLV